MPNSVTNKILLNGRPDGVPDEVMKKLERGAGNFARRKALQAAEEIAKRKIEAVHLYEPQVTQERFHSSHAKERLFQGGNRAGKSVACFMEDARAVLGIDPYDKYPKRDGVLAIVGYKEWHIGKVIYPFLFRAGAFKIIRDEETDLWRVWRPWVPADQERASECKPAPPLIPPRYIKTIAWKKKNFGVFDSVELTTGWKILAFSSTSKPDQGYQADLFHIDEDIVNEEHYNEAKGRLLDRNGKFIWSALPHDDNDALSRLAERAELQEISHKAGGPEPTSIVIRASMAENPYLPKEAKAEAISAWKSMGEDTYRKRALGELVTDTIMMYPVFRKDVHGVDYYQGKLKEVDTYLEKRTVPLDWCLRLAVDPGHQIGAALLIATPPSADFHLIFDEIYISGCDATKMATALEIKSRSRQQFQNFIIDSHGGNLTSLDTGIAPRESYENEMAKLRVECVDTGHHFLPGCSVIAYREEILRGMLAVYGSGVPKILYDPQLCPNFEREMRRFRKQRLNGVIMDKGNRRSSTHLVECCEYLAAFLQESPDPYVDPPRRIANLTPGQIRIRAYRQRIKDKRTRKAMSNFSSTSSATILGPQGA